MRCALTLHPDFVCEAVRNLAVEAASPRSGALTLRYIAVGAIDRLRLPARTAPARADDLWQHTCFELFVRRAAGEPYEELNFSPSTQWAAYRFDGYRDGRRDAVIARPEIHTTVGLDRFELCASIELAAGFRAEPLRLALSAVIEDIDGAKSYWALAHPPGEPDFHHAAGFALDLPEQT